LQAYLTQLQGWHAQQKFQKAARSDHWGIWEVNTYATITLAVAPVTPKAEGEVSYAVHYNVVSIDVCVSERRR
jgi:hypothetical protein